MDLYTLALCSHYADKMADCFLFYDLSLHLKLACIEQCNEVGRDNFIHALLFRIGHFPLPVG